MAEISKPSWDPYKTFQVSASEMDLIQRRAKRKESARAELKKAASRPGRPQILNDPTLMRIVAFNSVSARMVKDNRKSTWMGFLLFSPYIVWCLAENWRRRTFFKKRQVDGLVTYKFKDEVPPAFAFYV